MKTTLNLDNIDYRYEIYESPDSEEYGIFLLGALQDIDSVKYFSNHFSNTVNTIVIEAPGTGNNGTLEATAPIREQAKMVLKLIHYLEIDKAHLFAFSYATAISVELCDLWDGVQSLSIACGVPGIPKSGRESTLKVVAAAMNNNEDFANTFADVLLSDDPNIPRSKAIRKSVVAGVMKYDKERIESFIENSIRLLAHKPTNLDSIDVPCLILTGESDSYATNEITSDFHKKVKNAHLVTIKNADHMLHLQQPKKAAEAMILLAASHKNLVSTFKQLEM